MIIRVVWTSSLILLLILLLFRNWFAIRIEV